MKTSLRILLAASIVAILVAAYFYFRHPISTNRATKVIKWICNPQAHPEWAVNAGQRCGDAPFILPTDGFIGFLWDDSFQPNHRHQGIDIFGGAPAGEIPVIAAYDGYLTRLPDWKSTLIIRIPVDPLQPQRQIWNYYTHLADGEGNSLISPEFPPGTYEEPVKAGKFLGYQGDYSGTPNHPVGVHLHFSIVLDDGKGNFRNELEINNTLDPSPYFQLNLNAHNNQQEIPICPADMQSDS